ncbi:Mitochondrial carrier domain containing protein [Tylopilus felleus]
MAIQKEPGQKGVNWSNIAVGAIMNMVTTLGQPLEVLKTQMAANRSQTMLQATNAVWARGGVAGFFQGLIPWAWIEASTKGAVLLFTASEIESSVVGMGISPAAAGLLGGMGGGIAQAYATMGFTTCMKTVEITRHKEAASGVQRSTFQVFMDIYRKEGIRGINKGVNAVAVRQCTNWGSRMGFARLAETVIRDVRGKSEQDKSSAMDKILASSIGGALATWNQPIEVVRVEMQSMAKAANRPAKLTILNTLAFIYKENGIKGLYRGVTPRIGLGIWQTICMVSFADYVKLWDLRQFGSERWHFIPVPNDERTSFAKGTIAPLAGPVSRPALQKPPPHQGINIRLTFLAFPAPACEVIGSHAAGLPSHPTPKDASLLTKALARAHIDAKAFKMALYGFCVSAPLGHFLVGLLQKTFAGKVSLKHRLAQLLASNLLIAPIQTTAFLASMAVINGAKSVEDVIRTVKAGFLSVIRVNWVVSPLSMVIAQQFIPVEVNGPSVPKKDERN